ncbi:single-stranded DNA-binding protein [Streptococcus dysgalactiae subsp. equisimilis]
MINNVVLIGRLTKDVELRYTPSQVACAHWTKKGHLIAITGRIQTRNYENQHGQRVYVTEVVAESFQILEKRDNTANTNSLADTMPDYGPEPDLPF